MTEKQPLRIFAGLVKAVDWYDVSLQTMLEDLDMQSVNRTQSMILVHIAGGVTRPSDIAREMGTTRQNIHAMAKYLIENGIVTQVPDPNDGRSKQYAFSEGAKDLRDTVLNILSHLDQRLAERIGKDKVKSLQKILDIDWGNYVTNTPPRIKM